ncbi:MAG TPA: phospholipase D-like domain-containing protein [Acidobacteriota bacterium]|jgi:phosphatidylserine/phosphatidylglycerophosphate/cardiolipin synthase-like enzyme
MNLRVQPEDGVAPLLSAVNHARKSIEIAIFRFDYDAIEKALKAAVGRGVLVHALIAHTNGDGKKLRKVALALLEAGVTVTRTADNFSRYHDKILIIDGRELHLLGFNFTHLDIDHSRSFGVVTRNRKLVEEALKLLQADTLRQPYVSGAKDFVVSPENSRPRLSQFLAGARRQLLIYDPKLTDARMISVLRARVKAGVEIKVIGKLGKRGAGVAVEKFPGKRLHTRTIVRDGRQVFIGSQSLRKVELDDRREAGLIVRDPKIVKRVIAVFEADWAKTESGKKELEKEKKSEEKQEESVA